ncbi:glycosyltransferase family 2 protein [Microbacterium fluvii]|uniref:Glycosyltransferase family 2 protein n=1 Tax=Microbacterium fluvii TaxID=415215 RepID=A0ABW2H9Q0_9MICO|nr:glycosyltransferase family 2 protein [Microbacterium fluvii]MCU4671199.1 glycosyltransferase family 2 protein [Microbacterium fluvii]
MPDLIAIVTYKRPSLSDCVSSVYSQLADGDEVLIVDNDPELSARAYFGQLHHEGNVHYIAQPTPGIAAARNSALAFFRQHSFVALVFIDDDEKACEGWLESHKSSATSHRSHATFGPVEPVYPDSLPKWVRKLDFFARPNAESGTAVRWPATNNVRIEGNFLRANPDLTFSEGYSATGGSDTDFFFRAAERGAVLTWVAEAVVTEEVTPERGTARWLWRRGVRLGNVSTRMQLRKGAHPVKVLAIAVCRAIAAPVLAVGAIIRTRPVGPTLMNVPKAVGMVQALRGNLLEEYSREGAA